MEREDPRDAWVSSRFASVDALPQGAVVGTSSLRRVALLRALRPDLKVEPLRGNLDTRLKKLDDGHYDGIVLAAAGLKRLGLGARIRAVFDPEQMLPAAGQGALGIEVRSSRADVIEALQSLVHAPTLLAVSAERAVSRVMGGSCSMPLAAFATLRDSVLPPCWVSRWRSNCRSRSVSRLVQRTDPCVFSSPVPNKRPGNGWMPW